jgi:hypothetical protein
MDSVQGLVFLPKKHLVLQLLAGFMLEFWKQPVTYTPKLYA